MEPKSGQRPDGFQPEFKQEPTGDKQTQKFTVWSLDVLGHSPDECDSTLGCPCVIDCGDCDGDGCDVCEDTGRLHDDDGSIQHECDAEFTVNDRCRVGTLEIKASGTRYNVGTEHEFISYSPTDEEIVNALKEADYLKETVKTEDVEIDGESEYSMYVNEASYGRPLFQLERET